MAASCHAETDRAAEWVLERVYWRRSVPGSLVPGASELAAAGRSLVADAEWPV